MTLTTHIVIAGAAASPFLGSPFISFVAGVASHYIADSIPHWDWPLKTVTPSKEKKKA